MSKIMYIGKDTVEEEKIGEKNGNQKLIWQSKFYD